MTVLVIDVPKIDCWSSVPVSDHHEHRVFHSTDRAATLVPVE